jgi:acetyl-CoA carboxylase biotin carboxyl carrier protein
MTKKKPKSVVAKSAPASESSSSNGVVDLAEALAGVLHKHDLHEVEADDGVIHVRLRRGGEAVVMASHSAPAAASPVAAPVASTGRAETSDGNISYITSPFVGTFYRSPSPDSAPFVDTGSRVKKGQVLCIIEAMKLMNEIPAEVDATIVQCLVENGHPVEYGEPLFKIKA